MKKLTLIRLIIVLPFVACYTNLAAQTTVRRLPQNACYNKYYNAGTDYLRRKDYDPAIKQFEAAKYCAGLTALDKRILDSIIVDTYKKKKMVRVSRRV